MFQIRTYDLHGAIMRQIQQDKNLSFRYAELMGSVSKVSG